jgi:hypothetical protein
MLFAAGKPFSSFRPVLPQKNADGARITDVIDVLAKTAGRGVWLFQKASACLGIVWTARLVSMQLPALCVKKAWRLPPASAVPAEGNPKALPV